MKVIQDTPSRTGASFARGKSVQTFGTPPEFIKAVENRFGPLAYDLAADETNHKAVRWNGPGSVNPDSLVCQWELLAPMLCWLNPPFSNITPWAKKCLETLAANERSKILLLTPAGVDANWFRDYVHGEARVLFLNGRLCFDGKNPFPKGCLLSCYGWRAGYEVWDWRKSL